MKFDANERATVLAALRLFQRTYEDKDGKDIRRDWPDHFTRDNGTHIRPLGTDDISDLWVRINSDKE